MRNQNKKKRQDTGFTLIELLAVITIMGILMMVAIPAVSNTINNSRKDTFVSTSGEIVNAIKTAYNADSITCGGTNISAATGTTFYVPFGWTSSDNVGTTTDLTSFLDGGATSPFGGTTLKGYVKLLVDGTKVTYTISMGDGKHKIVDKNPKTAKRNDVVEGEYNNVKPPTTSLCIVSS